MGDASIQELIAGLKKLKREDLQKLSFVILKLLHPKHDHKQFMEDLQESKFSTGRTCPHCSSTIVIMFGSFDGRQRYRCKNPDCRKTFSDFTHSPLTRTRYPDKWVPFAECMLNDKTLRKTAKEIGIAVSTAFYWRHKLLKALQQLDLVPFEGIIEADETFFLFSEKGRRDIAGRAPRKRGGVASKRGLSHEQVCVLVAFDRDKDRTISKVACTGMISKASIDRVIGSLVTKHTVLCAEAGYGYRPYSKGKNIQTRAVEKGPENARDLPCPEREFVPLGTEEVDEGVQWCRQQIPERIPGLVRIRGQEG